VLISAVEFLETFLEWRQPLNDDLRHDSLILPPWARVLAGSRSRAPGFRVLRARAALYARERS